MSGHAQLLDALAPSIKLANQLSMHSDQLRAVRGLNFAGVDFAKMSKVMSPVHELRFLTEMNKSIEKMNSFYNPTLPLGLLRTMEEQNASMRAAGIAAGSSLGLIRASFKRNKEFLERIGAIAKPFAGLDKILRLNTDYAKAASAMASSLAWSKHFELPVIDHATAAAIGQMWGEGGVQKQLQEFGIDYDSFVSESSADTNMSSKAFPPSASLLSAPNVLSIIQIILTVLIFLWQQSESAESSKEIAGEIRDGFAKHDERMRALEKILEHALSAQQPQERGEVVYVVKSRAASIRETPQNGSKILAEVFSNQVVTLIDERGKWIQVEYFDWIHQEMRQGWVLRKYFARTGKSEKKNPDDIANER
ncbi:Hypothetical protein mma_1002 [Janthinobacterium sp. Marseille]|nr:Hypothetical protein mma_1002 [Janthinobacterium sp. Marseille]